ncbi:hypothetical protein [Pseudochryseolinea flava]|uniref:DUF1990 domain-containing protein n=1 Tax=Pseudochryseolinea flava TaxID=2059302 RepID=A0A364YA41_9BACT|nr:hypothetical protein [Pseudochryseolinea flava]RAW02758.1 hypothetical protein DQQ10_01220 [Pseudochryseolinea flava]
MSLHDKYLPAYDFHEVHETTINASSEIIYPIIRNQDFSGSWIIRTLFFLRGLPAKGVTIKVLGDQKFNLLEELQYKEILIGLIGQFWKPTGELQSFEPHEFQSFHGPYAKATWNFALVKEGERNRLITETRIACNDEAIKKSFSRYWFFIRPFSGLIRKEMLRAIKVKAEQQAKLLCA